MAIVYPGHTPTLCKIEGASNSCIEAGPPSCAQERQATSFFRLKSSDYYDEVTKIWYLLLNEIGVSYNVLSPTTMNFTSMEYTLSGIDTLPSSSVAAPFYVYDDVLIYPSHLSRYQLSNDGTVSSLIWQDLGETEYSAVVINGDRVYATYETGTGINIQAYDALLGTAGLINELDSIPITLGGTNFQGFATTPDHSVLLFFINHQVFKQTAIGVWTEIDVLFGGDPIDMVSVRTVGNEAVIKDVADNVFRLNMDTLVVEQDLEMTSILSKHTVEHQNTNYTADGKALISVNLFEGNPIVIRDCYPSQY